MKVLNPNKLSTAPITEFQATQGDLKFLSKENYNKLKKNIEKHGFDIPIYVWVDEDGVKHLLDGHQRKHVLETEGWFEPIPYLVIKANDLSQAAERLLEITSQYGTITQEGVDEFIATFELPEIEISSLTNFDGIFNFTIEPDPTIDQTPQQPEAESQLPVVSEAGKMYSLGEHRIVCGDPREAEVSPEKMDAYRKKYQKIITGSEDGWEAATPETQF